MLRSAWAAKDRVEPARELERVVVIRVTTTNMTNGAHFNAFSITPAISPCQSIEQLGCLTYVAFLSLRFRANVVEPDRNICVLFS